MDRPQNNPALPISTAVESIEAPTTGTTGFKERIVVEKIDNNPAPIDAPSQKPYRWVATNQEK
jgi:hypothetical protein